MAIGDTPRQTTPGARALEERRTGPYLIGRLVGLACHLADHRPGASCDRYASKLASGGLPPVPAAIATLEGMLNRDLRRPGTPAAYRAAVEEIYALLGDLGEWQPAPWPLLSPASADFVLGHHHQSAALTRARRDGEIRAPQR
jgi:hypothetical protein